MKGQWILPILFALFITSCSVGQYTSDAKPITHDIWDSLLRKHVKSDGLVDYRGFIGDSVEFQQYLDLLSSHHPNEANWTRQERLAYWINAYNAFTVKLIVDHYPVESIKDIKKGIPFVNTVWDIKFIQIEGATYDLNNIEHGIIRKNFDEPRIHFAVNCASIGCPALAPFAYSPEKLDQQLDGVTKDFLTDVEKNIIRTNEVKLSRIFKWYGGDFKKEGTLIDFINEYVTVDIKPDPDISYLDYDWRLNDYAL